MDANQNGNEPTVNDDSPSHDQSSMQPSMQSLLDSNPKIRLLVQVLEQEHNNAELLKLIQIKNRDDLRIRFINPLLEAGIIERTIPDTPNSQHQKYRLTEKGHALLKEIVQE